MQAYEESSGGLYLNLEIIWVSMQHSKDPHLEVEDELILFLLCRFCSWMNRLLGWILFQGTKFAPS